MWAPVGGSGSTGRGGCSSRAVGRATSSHFAGGRPPRRRGGGPDHRSDRPPPLRHGAAIQRRASRASTQTTPRSIWSSADVPFAKVTPHDPRHNRARHALHNYFLVKGLHLTRPGGLVAALTSRYTLDARNPAARRGDRRARRSRRQRCLSPDHVLRRRREPTSSSTSWSSAAGHPATNQPGPSWSRTVPPDPPRPR
ncbi:MAG: hypothetical protein U5R31_17055 [Acidimicrobiia bacterium]|nr:hypothetical protein [Acidimicrobiia bacterium]